MLRITWHTSTIRSLPSAAIIAQLQCLVLLGYNIRVWDVAQKVVNVLRILGGSIMSSVRCLDVCGNRVVSGSYDKHLRVQLPRAIVGRVYMLIICSSSCASFRLALGY